MSAEAAAATVARPSREPRQGRSKASFERMIAAARKLMAEKGSGDFTLADVSKAGKVSIGSIYCRFDSKDELIRAVQVRVLEEVDAEQLDLIGKAKRKTGTLPELVHRLVDVIAESLRRHGPEMRPLMLIASTDPVVATTGKESYAMVAEQVYEALLCYRETIGHPEPERAVRSAFRILYAAIARYLGFGSAVGAAWEGDWQVLKEDLSNMIAAFLLAPPAVARSA